MCEVFVSLKLDFLVDFTIGIYIVYKDGGFVMKVIKVKKFERGLLFINGEFERCLKSGTHFIIKPFAKIKVDVVSIRAPWLEHAELEKIVKSRLIPGDELLTIKVAQNQRVIVWVDENIDIVLQPGIYALWNCYYNIKIEHIDIDQVIFKHRDLEKMLVAGLLENHQVQAVDVNDKQRILLWLDNRFAAILTPGLYLLWEGVKKIKTEVVGVEMVRFEHDELNVILNSGAAICSLDEFVVEQGFEGVFFKNGDFVEVLKPGRYAFWKNSAKIKLFHKDTREQVLDISGQEIMTADNVTLRINALVNYNVKDVYLAVTKTEDVVQALYREAQIILRAVIGARELEALLIDKTIVTEELENGLVARVKELGIEICSFGIRDIILPGEMKELLNKVIEARKIAEANLISRREEVAAMRSQVNTARMLVDNPTLMRLKELEVLEKVASNSELKVLLGEKGLNDRIMSLI